MAVDVDRPKRYREARLDTANHRAATTVADDRNPRGTPIQHADRRPARCGSGDEVGQVVELAPQVACDRDTLCRACPGPIDETAEQSARDAGGLTQVTNRARSGPAAGWLPGVKAGHRAATRDCSVCVS